MSHVLKSKGAHQSTGAWANRLGDGLDRAIAFNDASRETGSKAVLPESFMSVAQLTPVLPWPDHIPDVIGVDSLHLVWDA